MVSKRNSIIRATITSSAELGQFSCALLLLRTCSTFGSGFAEKTLREYGKELPLFNALARLGIHPNRVVKWLADISNELDAYITETVDNIICTAMEAEFIDILTCQYRCRNFYVMRHDSNADKDRITTNYSSNFHIIDVNDIDAVADPIKSLLVVPVFDAVTDSFTMSYPNVNRIISDDTKVKFSDVVAVDLLGCPFHYYPSDLVQVSLSRFTGIVCLPITGRQITEYVEGN